MRIKALIAGLALCGAGCNAATATAPTTASAPVPAHHNIPATNPDGELWWLCATQPRQYVTAAGRSTWEEDHYLQVTPCPLIPIE